MRYTTTLNMNFLIDSKSIEDNGIEIKTRSMSGPPLSDTDFRKKWLRSEQPIRDFIKNKVKSLRQPDSEQPKSDVEVDC